MPELRLKPDTVDDNGLNEHLDQRSRLYQRNLHIKNMLRVQEFLDEESFRKWKRLRFGGEHPPADLKPTDQSSTERKY